MVSEVMEIEIMFSEVMEKANENMLSELSEVMEISVFVMVK
jgi:hypothetical protein